MIYKENTIDVLIVSILIACVCFANSNLAIARFTLYISFIGGIIILPVMKKKIVFYHKSIITKGLLLIAYNFLILSLYPENFKSIYNCFLYNACIAFFLIIINLKFDDYQVKLFTRLMSIISQLLFIFGVFNLFFKSIISWVSMTTVLFLLLYFIYIDRKNTHFRKIFFSVLWIIIAIENQERTYIMLFPILIGLIIIWHILIKRKWIYKLFFYILSLSLFTIPLIYILLSKSIYAVSLDQYVLNLTGSRFFSGRNLIWSRMFEYYIEGSILFGGGHHVNPSYVYGGNVSTHNTFITILVTTGIIGVFLFLRFIVEIWRKYYINSNENTIKLSAIFFIISLLKQSSELSLISNNIAVSFINWIIIAYGLISVNSIKRKGR